MTKQELMENHTAEQLAEMVVELQNELNIARNLQNEVLFEERIAENIRKIMRMNIDDVRKTLQDTKKYMNDKYVEELQSEVEKYHKAFEDTKNERDCQIAEYQKKIEELTAERDFLSKDNISVHQDPIDIAKDLINAEGEYEHNPLEKALFGADKGTYRIFDIRDLRQIAEHLLVYCNHNGEV